MTTQMSKEKLVGFLWGDGGLFDRTQHIPLECWAEADDEPISANEQQLRLSRLKTHINDIWRMALKKRCWLYPALRPEKDEWFDITITIWLEVLEKKYKPDKGGLLQPYMYKKVEYGLIDRIRDIYKKNPPCDSDQLLWEVQKELKKGGLSSPDDARAIEFVVNRIGCSQEQAREYLLTGFGERGIEQYDEHSSTLESKALSPGEEKELREVTDSLWKCIEPMMQIYRELYYQHEMFERVSLAKLYEEKEYCRSLDCEDKGKRTFERKYDQCIKTPVKENFSERYDPPLSLYKNLDAFISDANACLEHQQFHHFFECVERLEPHFKVLFYRCAIWGVALEELSTEFSDAHNDQPVETLQQQYEKEAVKPVEQGFFEQYDDRILFSILLNYLRETLTVTETFRVAMP